MSEPQADPAPKTVLIVDDSKTIRMTLGTILQRSGWTCLEAEDAYRALAMLESTRPALVFADYEMPGMNGIDLCRRIRAQPRTASIPVVLITAKADAKLRSEGFAAGAEDFLHKPIKPEDLQSVVARFG